MQGKVGKNENFKFMVEGPLENEDLGVDIIW